MRSVGDSGILCRARDLFRAVWKQGPRLVVLVHATPIAIVNVPGPDSCQIGAEVPFVVGDVFELSSDGERTLSKAMGCYWTNFAATSNPNHGSSNCSIKLGLQQ